MNHNGTLIYQVTLLVSLSTALTMSVTTKCIRTKRRGRLVVSTIIKDSSSDHSREDLVCIASVLAFLLS
jgi:hypothetical protein